MWVWPWAWLTWVTWHSQYGWEVDRQQPAGKPKSHEAHSWLVNIKSEREILHNIHGTWEKNDVWTQWHGITCLLTWANTSLQKITFWAASSLRGHGASAGTVTAVIWWDRPTSAVVMSSWSTTETMTNTITRFDDADWRVRNSLPLSVWQNLGYEQFTQSMKTLFGSQMTKAHYMTVCLLVP